MIQRELRLGTVEKGWTPEGWPGKATGAESLGLCKNGGSELNNSLSVFIHLIREVQ